MARKQDTVAIVYAQALIDLAFEKGVHAEILNDVREVRRALSGDPRALTFLIAPHIRRDAKKQVIDRALGNRASETVTNFLKVLIDKGRQTELMAVLDTFEQMYHERLGEKVVHVKSAVALDDRERDRLKATLKRRLKKEIVLQERIEPALLGGLIVRVDDAVVDGSLRHRLATVANRLEDIRLTPEEVFGS